MAHRIIYKPSGIILSSTLGDIAIAVDGDFVDVTLTATAKTILSERYYAYGGNVTLYDLAPLIEAEMRSSGQTYAQFTLRVFTDLTNNKADSCVLHILYCDSLIIRTTIRKDVDIVPVILNDRLSYIPWGGNNQMPFDIIEQIEKD